MFSLSFLRILSATFSLVSGLRPSLTLQAESAHRKHQNVVLSSNMATTKIALPFQAAKSTPIRSQWAPRDASQASIECMQRASG